MDTDVIWADSEVLQNGEATRVSWHRTLELRKEGEEEDEEDTPMTSEHFHHLTNLLKLHRANIRQVYSAHRHPPSVKR